MTVLKISKLKGSPWKTLQVDGKIFFLIRIFYLSAAVAIATFEIYG